MKKFGIAILAALMLVPGCGNMSNLASGSLIGSGAGAAITLLCAGSEIKKRRRK